MKSKWSDTSLFTETFLGEAARPLGIHNDENPMLSQNTVQPTSNLPVLNTTSPSSNEELRAYWRKLRAFFHSARGGHFPAEAEGAHLYPALLAPYRHQSHLERNFPFWMEETEGGQFKPLNELLTACIARSAPDEAAAKLLKDNLLRLSGIVEQKVGFAEDAYQAYAVIDEALMALVEQLQSDGLEGETFINDVNNLRKHIPRQGLLLPFSPNVPFYLLAAVLREHRKERCKLLQDKVHKLTAQLKNLLAVEQEKSPEAHSPDKLKGTLGFTELHFNFDELASVMTTGGSTLMPEERLHRIEKIVSVLEDIGTNFFQKNDAFIILAEELAESTRVEWEKNYDQCTVLVAPKSQSCHLAKQVFDEKMAEIATLFAAIRTAELEIGNQYYQDIHGDYFAHFDWRSFTAEELAICPPIILNTYDNSLIEKELNEFSQLLTSMRPVKMLVVKQGVEAIVGALTFRQELSSLAIAHRNAFILQSASVAPAKLVEGFREGLGSQVPSLFYVITPKASASNHGSLSIWTRAAIFGREFPSFVYNSEQGERWDNRFDILNNPQPAADWPLHRLHFRDEKGDVQSLDLPFTFADFAALDGHYAQCFHLVPPQFWSENLVPLGDYLNLSPDELHAKLPYIWVIDEQNNLQKAAVAWPLVLTCRERLDFWHFLQENAGIHSYHVEQATVRLRREMETEFLNKTVQLETAYEKAREAEVRLAIERILTSLLDMDSAELTATLASGPVSTVIAPIAEPLRVAPVPQAAAEKGTQPVAPKQEPKMATSLGGPWIESALCTSCNDCINLNKRMFNYNEKKQAYVADSKAGTFKELVMAAEKCPVCIIHPGSPLNPNEPGLDGLIKRAEKFN
jgi:hypothetical protein